MNTSNSRVLKCILLVGVFIIGILVEKNHIFDKAKMLGISVINEAKYFYKKHRKYHKGKPVLFVKVEDWDHKLYEPLVFIDILKDKYHIVYVKNTDKNYDILVQGIKIAQYDLSGVVDNIINENPKAVKLFWTYEAIKPNIEKYDLSVGYDFIDSPKYIRIPYYYYSALYNVFPMRLKRDSSCNPHKTRFACMLVSNNAEVSYINKLPWDGVIARDRIFHLLSLYKKVYSGGMHLNNIRNSISIEVDQTKEFLGQCKFVIAYENQTYPGYITEKVFQAYAAGAIPIYYADKTTVERDLNTSAIILAQNFNDEDALVEYIKRVDNDNELYCKIWNQPLIENFKEYDAAKAKLKEKLLQLIKEKLNK